MIGPNPEDALIALLGALQSSRLVMRHTRRQDSGNSNFGRCALGRSFVPLEARGDGHCLFVLCCH
jgi:hypothetical protein